MRRQSSIAQGRPGRPRCRAGVPAPRDQRAHGAGERDPRAGREQDDADPRRGDAAHGRDCTGRARAARARPAQRGAERNRAGRSSPASRRRRRRRRSAPARRRQRRRRTPDDAAAKREAEIQSQTRRLRELKKSLAAAEKAPPHRLAAGAGGGGAARGAAGSPLGRRCGGRIARRRDRRSRSRRSTSYAARPSRQRQQEASDGSPSRREARAAPTPDPASSEATRCRTAARRARSGRSPFSASSRTRAAVSVDDHAVLEQHRELVLVLPAPGAAIGLGDDVERDVHRLDASLGAAVRLLEVDVPAPLLAALEEREPDSRTSRLPGAASATTRPRAHR